MNNIYHRTLFLLITQNLLLINIQQSFLLFDKMQTSAMAIMEVLIYLYKYIVYRYIVYNDEYNFVFALYFMNVSKQLLLL